MTNIGRYGTYIVQAEYNILPQPKGDRMTELYLEISGYGEYDGWFPQRVSIRHCPPENLREYADGSIISGFKSFHPAGDRWFDDDEEVITMQINEPYRPQYQALLAEGKQIGRLADEYDDDHDYIVLAAMLHRLLKLTGAKYVCCGQW